MEQVHWLGHAGIKITGSRTVYVDPYLIAGRQTADLILITHDHYDHLSREDIKKIHGDETVIVVPKSMGSRLPGHVEEVSPGDTLTLQGVKIQVVPSYNIGKPFHPKEKRNVGYVFTLDKIAYYHAGDTDRIPEMKSIRADVAFLPVGGTYTMSAAEAAAAAADIEPKVAVPIHWGSVTGSSQDAQDFKRLGKCEVRILEPDSES
jgi:L-ascorbate metabolism protein UlaG (beta-lactamase superfamily)